ncbi:putative Uncharacterized oxidoreductase C23D3.11 [Glarea lozoyensis 74030]|uniref:Putative Uncharacterized oxidoreductase C23D3.11 n=1 Tax=Glarea lozoyensis (strain ATCC 74030 / MF5533) TaxID=1104152 RepID=H0EL02_GLAL7|nr:putative Uncharacterized oxidoreductase C23D3.11 [Glarea lozoyensis 74030]
MFDRREESIETAVQIVNTKTGGKLDFLINNAGLGIVAPAIDADIKDAKKMFDANFWGAVEMVQAFSPLIISAKGTIGNVAALGAILHVPWMSFYGASKAALVNWTEVLRLEMAPFRVKVVPIMTGFVHTNIFNQGHGTSLPRESLYWPAHKEIDARSAGSDVTEKMDANVYANKVVNDLTNGADGRIYRGGMSSGAKFITTFLPNSMVDKMMLGGTGLDKPAELQAIQAARKATKTG